MTLSPNPSSILVALGISAALASAGARFRWLDSRGAIAATAVGAAFLACSGVSGAALLALFFTSSSLLTDRRTPVSAPAGPANRGRTWRQVLANGGIGAVGALLVPSSPEVGWPIVVGALAAAQADTWATEIGAWSPRPPRLITSGRPVPVGTSGGVTLLGTVASVAGAVLLGGVALALGIPAAVALAGAAGGVAGSLADSVAGATIQGAYHCPACDRLTERRLHGCGQPARLTRGSPLVDNDAVNLIATAGGGAAALALHLLFHS